MTYALAHVLVAYMILLMPWIGRYKYRRLQQFLAAGKQNARLHFYRLGVLQQWLLVGVILLLAWLASLPVRTLGLEAPYSWAVTQQVLIPFAVAIGFSIVLFRLTGDRFLLRLLKMAGALIPTTARERLWFAAISIGAGVSEELLFRGFLLWYLHFFWPQLNLLELIVLSSSIFGLCHIYQGWTGILGTGVLGAVFAWLFLLTGSLLVPMIIHALVDLRILAIFTPGRIRSLVPIRAGEREQQLQKAGSSTTQMCSF